MSPSNSFTRNDAVPKDGSYDESKLKGKSVIVTGGASGIGEATMRAFVKTGAFVTFGDLAEDRAADLVAELGEKNVAFSPCNVLSWDDQVKLFKTALAKSPSKTIDVVVANAGISGQDDIFNQKEDESGEPIEPDLSILKVNLIGVAYTAKLAQFYFPKQPVGEGRDRCLLLTASLAAYLDQPGSPQYCSSKWGVRGMMHSIRVTTPMKSIRVNLIAPWFISTRIMSQEVKDRVTASGIDWADTEDAASALLHLASDSTFNGRGLVIVPKSINPRGYFDLEMDDLNDDNPMTAWQKLAVGIRHRVGTDQGKDANGSAK